MSISGIWVDVFADTSKTDTMLGEVAEIAYKEADESKLLWRGKGRFALIIELIAEVSAELIDKAVLVGWNLQKTFLAYCVLLDVFPDLFL